MYADFLATAAFFDEILLFMDCCRDDLWRAPGRIPPWQSLRDSDAGGVKRFYGLATQWAQKAREAPTPEGTVHGYFTRALKAAFEGGAVDINRRLTTSTVMSFVINYIQGVIKPELTEQTFKAPEPQFPQRGRFPHSHRPDTQVHGIVHRLLPASQANKSQFVLMGGAAAVSRTNSTGADPWLHELGFGHYAVLDAGGAIAREFDAFGEKVDLNV